MSEAAADDAVADDRLRLIFTCCHPALAPEARVALTLRTLGGLTHRRDRPRLPRHRAGDGAAAGPRQAQDPRRADPLRGAAGERLPERLAAVLATLYLIFNEGYLATASDALVRAELCAEAIRLGRPAREPSPRASPRSSGLLALMLLHDSRRAARVDGGRAGPARRPGPLALGSRRDRRGARASPRAAPGGRRAARTRSRPRSRPSTRAPRPPADTDWARIARLYDWLAGSQPSPVVELNRAVAVAMDERAGARPRADRRDRRARRLPALHSARADLLRRLERRGEATRAYERALELTGNPVERSFLERRRAEL